MFVYGIDKKILCKKVRKTEKILSKTKKNNNTQKVLICGFCNNYCKTDHDTTFIRMKEDAMGNDNSSQPLTCNIV